MSAFHAVSGLWYGQFSPEAERGFRAVYGVLLLLQLIWTWPHARRFLTTERHGGYIESSAVRDAIHNTMSGYFVMAVWTACAVCLIVDRAVLIASLVSAVLAYYFFLHLRWKTILRGMGAPGHMNYWISAFLALLALADSIPSSIPLRSMVAIAFRIDFALIMLFAGIYKVTAGYARGDGFERGLVNPWWGWWSRMLRTIPPRSVFFGLLDHAGYSAEIACAICFFIPAAAPYGALLLGASFLGIAAVIRLTFLAEMVAGCCLIYVWPGSLVDRFFGSVFPTPTATFALPSGVAMVAGTALCLVLAVYVALLPFGYAVMCTNFYFKRRAPEGIQRFFDAWNRAFGLILWRVFTNDIICFFCDIFEEGPEGHSRPLKRRLRFNHVGEFICLASLFTTLKYYPGQPELFHARLLRYAKSLSRTRTTYRYFRISKAGTEFSYLPIAEFTADPSEGTVEERVLDPRYDVRSSEPGSPIHTAGRPGSYAPVSS